ncbi:MAG TPA: biotin--[acetyl-CoA-carboxylase] ligase [Acidimicrobiales bacterium]|nr:biotin--[acetyl-CoA-carboxylase] ligase [Acidimicrobiales bacterium]
MTTPIGRTRFTDVRRVDETGSTNDDLMALGRRGEPEGIVLVAGHQTGGRGRHGRTWSAPPGMGLLCSVLLRPPAAVAELITATVAVALLDALESLGATGVGIKWPNDLIVATSGAGRGGHRRVERKLAGILAEADAPVGSSTASGQRAPKDTERLLVVVGSGVNVNTPTELPVEVADRFIALDALVSPTPGVDEVLEAYLEALERAHALVLADRDGLLERWRERCVTIGRDVRVDLGVRDLRGVAMRIDGHGRLVVRSDGGVETAVAAGDVVHLGTEESPAGRSGPVEAGSEASRRVCE